MSSSSTAPALASTASTARAARVAAFHAKIREEFRAQLDGIQHGRPSSRIDIALDRVREKYPIYGIKYLMRICTGK